MVAIPDIPSEVKELAEELPRISPILGKIDKLLSENETTAQKLVRIIRLDKNLGKKLLAIVNSSFYGLPEKTDSLVRAVMLLGVETTRNFIISIGIFSDFFKDGKQLPMDLLKFRLHCLGTAIGCKLLAENLGIHPDEIENFFLAGLLHDIGKILLLKASPQRYKKALKESHNLGVSLNFAELAHFGCSHTHAGRLLATKWELDDAVADVIADHHSPLMRKNDLLKNLVTISNNMCKRKFPGMSGNCVVEEIPESMTGRLGIDPGLISGIENQLPSEVKKMPKF